MAEEVSRTQRERLNELTMEIQLKWSQNLGVLMMTMGQAIQLCANENMGSMPHEMSFGLFETGNVEEWAEDFHEDLVSLQSAYVAAQDESDLEDHQRRLEQFIDDVT